MPNKTINNLHTINRRLSMQGFSLIEMMLSMLIGSIILAGIFTVFANTKEAQRTMDQQLAMIGDARFATELLTYDLRHASIYGGTNLAVLIECRSEDTACSDAALTPVVADDCVAGWVNDLELPVYSPLTDAEVDGWDCSGNTDGDVLRNHVAGTDVLVIRYADTTPATAPLVAGALYVRSNYKSGVLFVGPTQPTYAGDTLDAFTNNYRFITRAYYISDFTDDVDDGIPSLRRVELQAVGGVPTLVDQLLMSGVQDLQVQFGVDTNGDDQIESYVNAASVSAQSIYSTNDANRAIAKQNWENISAVKIWTLVRAAQPERNFNTSVSGTGYQLGGFTIPNSVLNNGFRRLLLSNVVRMRNMER